MRKCCYLNNLYCDVYCSVVFKILNFLGIGIYHALCCRLCLEDLSEAQTRECTNAVRCEQYDGSYHSSSVECGWKRKCNKDMIVDQSKYFRNEGKYARSYK